MERNILKIDLADDADVSNLSKIKTLLYHHLQHKPSPPLIGKLYLNQGLVYCKIKNYPLAHEAWEKAASYFKDFSDPFNLALTYYYQGLLFSEEEEVVKALEKWNQVLVLLSDDQEEKALLKCQTLYQIGKTLLEIGELERANEYLKKGARIAKQGKYIYEEALITQELARVWVKMGEWNRALQLYYKTIAKWKELKEERRIGMVLDDLGYLYCQLGDVKKAINAFKYSLRIQKKYQDEDLSQTLLQLGRLYLRIDPEKTKYYCQEIIKILLEELGYRFTEAQEKQLAHVFFLMGLYCREKSDRKNMLMFLKQSLSIYKKFHMEAQWYEVYKIYKKYAQSKIEERFNEAKELVNQLVHHEKLRLHKFIG
ncbi:hypothetical protein BBF96_15335 [Anoxybacter fermentans]|uniref:Uncharacterized protein n=1 Tax=Anoxybacter fermentans TaxID=1323375 RepID=A0A3Q9HUF4_9FIRM|nr:tetratricopeptide repeat protein [Anoxybacter fermentans]AZR74626.1 hypothetical protein BBF96_15335 [Anoxybacter fermentans]